MQKQFFNLLKIGVSLTLLILIFYKLDLGHLLTIVQQANPGWLTLALVIMFCGIIIRSWRWQILLKAIGIQIPLRELISIYLIGFLFNNLLPSGVGGDAMRVFELNRQTQRGSDAVTSVIVERFLGLSALQAIGGVALLFNWQVVSPTIALITGLMFTSVLVSGYVLINKSLYFTLQKHLPPFRRLTEIKGVGNLFTSFQSYPLAALRQAYLVSLLFNLTLISMNICIGNALGIQASLMQYAIFTPITSGILIIPVSFGGLGLREWIYMQLFSSIGVIQEKGVVMSLLVYTIGNLCTGLVGGFVYLLRAIYHEPN